MVSWNSSNSGIASIGANGSATGLMAGTTNITASASGMYSSPVALTVSQSFGPTGFTLIPQQNYNYTLPAINKGNTVNFSFSSSGALVYYWVYDPNTNIILTGNGGNKVSSGAGSFIAASSGEYTIQFHCSGVLSSSAITINGTIN